MLCKDCPFIFTCWRGQQGENWITRNSVTACPKCGRWTVHMMAPLVATEQGNNFLSRVDMHYVFFCEQRSTEANLAHWKEEFYTQGAVSQLKRGAFDDRKVELNVSSNKVGLVLCYLCRDDLDRHARPQVGPHTRVRRERSIDLDNEPFEMPPYWKEPK